LDLINFFEQWNLTVYCGFLSCWWSFEKHEIIQFLKCLRQTYSTKHLPYGKHLELNMNDIVKLNGIIEKHFSENVFDTSNLLILCFWNNFWMTVIYEWNICSALLECYSPLCSHKTTTENSFFYRASNTRFKISYLSLRMTTETALKDSLVCNAHLQTYSTKHLPYGKHLELNRNDIVKLNGI
jgi:hypothetical protein